jgi:hypothetical protein
MVEEVRVFYFTGLYLKQEEENLMEFPVRALLTL